MPHDHWEAITEIEAWTQHLGKVVIGEEDMIDVVGRVRGIERRLAELRKNLTTELPDIGEGHQYRIESSRRAKRSYNTHRILQQFGARTDHGLFHTIRSLIDLDALRLQWNWTGLNRAADVYDVPLEIAKHEIADGDPESMIGEVWETQVRVVEKAVTE